MKYKLPVKVVHTLLIVLLYISALVLWPLYQFYEKLGGKLQRSSDEDCTDGSPPTCAPRTSAWLWPS